MSMSQTTFLSDIMNGGPIPVGKLAYFQARLSNLLHEAVLSRFLKLEKERGLTRADLARRIGRKPEQVTRWFGSPGNWTLETVSDLLIAMECELDPVLKDLARHEHAHALAHSDALMQNDAASTEFHPGLFQLNDGSVIIVFQQEGTAYALSIPLTSGTQVFQKDIATQPVASSWLAQNDVNGMGSLQRWSYPRMFNQPNQSNLSSKSVSQPGLNNQSYLLGQGP